MTEVSHSQGSTERPRTAREIRETIPLTERPLLTEEEAAALIGVCKWTFRRFKTAGLISPVELPMQVRRNLYRLQDVEALAAGR